MSSSIEASREELISLVAAQAREIEQLRQQRAVASEVLRAINRPGFHLDAILSRLTKSAADLCEAGSSALFLRDGDRLVPRGTANLDPHQDAFVRSTPAPVDETSYIGRAVLHGTISNVPDFLALPGSSLTMFQQILGFRALLVVPLMREGKGVGVFTLASKKPGEFTQRQVELVQSFGDQAALAVQNASFLQQLQDRSDELARSLAQLSEAQDRLARSARLASLGRLVAGVAHEMNTPVGNALTIASAMEDDARQLTTTVEAGRLLKSDLTRRVGRLEEGAGLMRANLARAIGLIQRFRQVSSDRLDGERRRIEVGPWANAVFQNHSSLAKSDHAFRVECPDDLTADAHPESWGQIIVCLVDNSLQHAFPAGQAGLLQLNVREAEPDGLYLAYSDNGSGIAMDELAHVFEPFYTTARAAGAAGLGLHIVHNLVAALGGQVSIASEIGAGTRFSIRLPVR